MSYRQLLTPDILKTLRHEARWGDEAAAIGDETTREYCDMCKRAADEIERLRAELAAFTLPLTPACRRWRLGEDSGEVFDIEEDFTGLTLTIELLDRDEAQRVTEAMLRQIGGVD